MYLKAYIVFVTIFLFLSGCSHIEEEAIDDLKTIEQELLDNDITSSNILYTEELENSAFSIFEKTNGFGVYQFSLNEKGWSYQGHSGFTDTMDPTTRPISFTQSTWINGPVSMEQESTYTTLFLGVINDTKISNVTLSYNNVTKDANIINNNDTTYWYIVSENDKGDEQPYILSAYSNEGELLYER